MASMLRLIGKNHSRNGTLWKHAASASMASHRGLSTELPDQSNFANLTQSQKIRSAEEMSNLGKNLLSGSLFSGTDMSQSTEQIYKEWAETYEHDMGTIKFDCIQTLPTKIGAYLEPDSGESSEAAPPEVEDGESPLILDVGCGTGLLGEVLQTNSSSELPRENLMIDGMDLTQEMLDILEKERGDLYNTVQQHDMQETPWPFDDSIYDMTVCNGVLVYIKENIEKCLEEFVRVTKPGGHCMLMLRHDCLGSFSPMIYQLITEKKWEIAEITNTRYNYIASVNNQKKYMVPYNHHIFQVL